MSLSAKSAFNKVSALRDSEALPQGGIASPKRRQWLQLGASHQPGSLPRLDGGDRNVDPRLFFSILAQCRQPLRCSLHH